MSLGNGLNLLYCLEDGHYLLFIVVLYSHITILICSTVLLVSTIQPLVFFPLVLCIWMGILSVIYEGAVVHWNRQKKDRKRSSLQRLTGT